PRVPPARSPAATIARVFDSERRQLAALRSRLGLARRDLLQGPACVLSHVRIGIVGDQREERLALRAGGLSPRGPGFLAQIGLLVGDAMADRPHRALDLHPAEASDRLESNLPE